MSGHSKFRVTLAVLCLAGCGGQVGTSLQPRTASDSAGQISRAPDPLAAGNSAPGELPGGAAKSGNEPAATGTALKRQIIYDAVVTIFVTDFEDIPTKVEHLVQEAGGFVAHNRIQGRAGSPRRGEWKVRIPLGGYSGFLQAARTLGELQGLSADSQDVTEQYYDLQSRIRNKQTEETRLLRHLEQSTDKLDEILAVEREVSRVREELERMEGRMRVLQDLTALATVTLNVDEIRDYVPPQSPAFTARVGRAFGASWDALVTTGKSLVIAGAVLLPWFGACGVPLCGLVWGWRRRRSRTA